MTRGAFWTIGAVTVTAAAVWAGFRPAAYAQAAGPEMLKPGLSVRTWASNLVTPIGIAFLAPNDALVLEKDTGRVQRVIDGAVTGTVLDLGVNNTSERGLLSIALHPRFPEDRGVYLYWTCRSSAPPTDSFVPDEERCLDANMIAPDSDNILEVPLLGNRVDRFVWDGSNLQFDRNLIMLRAFQNDGAPTPPDQGDAAQPARGNHNGGVIRFGPDGKLYVQVGDVGRRGQLQNLSDGPGGSTRADDQFGGPEPDDAHLTGVILRLNDDGSTPDDNPFHAAGEDVGGEVGANIQKIYAYGLRNGFGMAFDPRSGHLWEQENGDDSFSELNRVDAGFNSGWVQIMGPVNRIRQFKTIETTVTPEPPDPNAPNGYFGLQQLRWSPVNIADSAAEALDRLFELPGAEYSPPEFSWLFEVAPGGIGFASAALGPQFAGDLFMGAARDFLEGGHLFHFNLTGNRRAIAVDDPRLRDRVADNRFKFDLTESESLLVGRNFGVAPDVRSGPNGNLYVVSISKSAVYEIFARRRQ